MRRMSYPFGAGTWRSLLFLCLGLMTTTVCWLAALTAIIGGTLLGVTVVGGYVVPVLLRAVALAADLERRRLGLLGIAASASPTTGQRLFGFPALRSRLADSRTWRDLAWLLLALPVNTVAAVASLVLWLTGLGLLLLPLWYRWLPDGQAKLYDVNGAAYGVVADLRHALPWAVLGAVLLIAAGLLTRWGGSAVAGLARWLLSASAEDMLRARVVQLSSTRAAAVDNAHRHLQRIERDLHDGAQARLVALGADLGLAEERFAEDPVAARALVAQARDELTVALAELRDLVRGMGPPILADRGLAAALDVIAARSAIPVAVRMPTVVRFAPVVEATIYFVVCECITNAVKHSQARQIQVDMLQKPDSCSVTVVDDGIGGASPHGHGLVGLRERVAALDGVLIVTSPVGGPTTIRVELPCAS